MPLLDHFHPPLFGARRWESFHAQWAVNLAARLNQDWLPDDYFAETQTHVGGRIEVDIAAFDSVSESRRDRDRNGPTSSTATAEAQVWTPPAPALRWPATFPDVVEVLVYDRSEGPILVGAVELVSPGNKDRPEAKRAFASKCASYLQEGIGLVVVDIVTSRRANLHDELVDLLRLGGEYRMPTATSLYATAYHPFRHPALEATDVWLSRLAVGEDLPTLPLILRGGPCLPIELESTYAESCRRSRLA